MNTRLKIICLLFAIAYLFIIGDTIVQSFTVEIPEELQIDDPYQMGIDKGKRIHDALEGRSPFWTLFVPGLITILLSISLLGLFTYIPILTYKVIRSIVKDNIFDMINIKRIRKIGYALLIAFLAALPIYPLTQYLYSFLFGISDISALGSIRDDYSLCLFGLLVLLFAEILKLSLHIKEENDLTV